MRLNAPAAVSFDTNVTSGKGLSIGCQSSILLGTYYPRNMKSYAARKGLAVNVQKSYIVNFNAYRNSAVPVFRLYNQELEERDSFTYLGMLFDKHMNLTMLRPML